MRLTLFVREDLLFDYGIWNLHHVESCHTHTRSLFTIKHILSVLPLGFLLALSTMVNVVGYGAVGDSFDLLTDFKVD